MFDYKKQNDWQPDGNYLQSPVDIKDDNVKILHQLIPFAIVDQIEITKIENTGNNIKYSGIGKAMIFGHKYNFQQLHFHHPAEHLINGKAADFEIHFVFTNEIGQMIVVAILLNVGEDSPFVQQLIEQKLFNPQLKIPTAVSGYHYLGSLTNPPLIPGVEWLIVTDPILSIGKEQLEWFKQHFAENARDVQPMQNRTIEKFE
ncbi:carbonic anhydrase family protein [Fructilactobacillus sp. Tb1]|uniref:carbonic anhydrase family protein n=1 Tax=Fructilactobacillus sp. Tb1 TaxID=3422304 RepID=UPI003D2843B4